jgi:hypothetical protein
LNGESGEATSRKAAWLNARNAPWGRSGWARRSTKYQGAGVGNLPVHQHMSKIGKRPHPRIKSTLS